MKIKVSAPGKLMLMGEHAVIYGYPCIVTAVDKRMFVEVETTEDEKDVIETPQVKESRFVSESIKYFKDKFKILKSLRIRTFSDFLYNYGLGSSSAVTVATIFALNELFRINLTSKEIFNFCFQINLKVQGAGSGFDIAAATFGGTIYFVTGGKVIEPLKISSLPLVVGYSGVKASTTKIVQNLKFKISSDLDDKQNIYKMFKNIAEIVKKAKNYLIEDEYLSLGESMNENHKLLKELGVSTPKLDNMVTAAVESGAYGAKLSGAGGGDCMIALIDERIRQQVEMAIKDVGGEIIDVKNNAEGAKIED